MKLRLNQARWGLLATTLILGLTLIGTTWSGHRSILRASTQLTQSQGVTLIEEIRRDLSLYPSVPSADELLDVLHRHQANGLLYVSIRRMKDQDVLVSAGESVSEAHSPERGDRGWIREGDIYFLVAPAARPDGARPPGRRGDGPRPHSPRGTDGVHRRPPGGPGGPGGPPPGGPGPNRNLWLSIEFEALTAKALRQQTAGSLALGATSALVLMVVALLFWNQARAREQDQQLLEQQKRLSALGEMSAVMAHEIRNPLASLKGHAQLLAEQLGDEPGGRKVRRIVQEATRLEKLTTDLLAFVRSGALDRRPANPMTLIEEIREELNDDRLRIVDPEAAPVSWSLDPIRLRQALSNLIRNALQASPSDTPIEVAARAEESSSGPELLFTVRDRGPGLPQGRENKIFEPFFTTRTRGTGLGLAVAQRIVESHGGRLIGRNHPEGGAEFKARIPES